MGRFIRQCLELASSTETNVGRFGIPPPHQVLLHVAGIQIVVLELHEAVTRADLFTPTRCMALLREMTHPWNDATFPSKMMTAVSSKSSLRPTTTTMTTTTTTTTVKRCIHGANCRHIRTGNRPCGFYRTKHEIAADDDGAIVEKVIGISTCKVNRIMESNGNRLTEIAQQSGADVWMEDELVGNNVRILHAVGRREAVNKAKKLIMQSVTIGESHDGTQMSYSVEELIGTSASKAKSFVGENGAAIQKLADASGATIWLDEDRQTLHVKGCREALSRGIHLVLKWAAQCDRKIVADSTTMPSTLVSTPIGPTTADESSNSIASSALAPTANVSSKSLAPLKDDATFPRLAKSEKVARSVATASGFRRKPPVKLKEESAWPALKPPSADTAAQCDRKHAAGSTTTMPSTLVSTPIGPTTADESSNNVASSALALTANVSSKPLAHLKDDATFPPLAKSEAEAKSVATASSVPWKPPVKLKEESAWPALKPPSADTAAQCDRKHAAGSTTTMPSTLVSTPIGPTTADESSNNVASSALALTANVSSKPLAHLKDDATFPPLAKSEAEAKSVATASSVPWKPPVKLKEESAWPALKPPSADTAAQCDRKHAAGSTTTMPSTLVSTPIGPTPADESSNNVASSALALTANVSSKPLAHLKDDATFPPLAKSEAEAKSVATASSVPWKPPVKLKEESAWPALKPPSADTAAQCDRKHAAGSTTTMPSTLVSTPIGPTPADESSNNVASSALALTANVSSKPLAHLKDDATFPPLAKSEAEAKSVATASSVPWKPPVKLKEESAWPALKPPSADTAAQCDRKHAAGSTTTMPSTLVSTPIGPTPADESSNNVASSALALTANVSSKPLAHLKDDATFPPLAKSEAEAKSVATASSVPWKPPVKLKEESAWPALKPPSADTAAQCDRKHAAGSTTTMPSTLVSTPIGPTTADESSNNVASSALALTANVSSKPLAHLKDDATFPPLAKSEAEAKSVATASSVPWKPPVKLKEESAWPALKPPSAGTGSQQVPNKPAIQPALKPSILLSATRIPKATKKETKSGRSGAKINYKHPCIHGAKCQYIQSGRDECKFFHSTHEIEQAAARNLERKIHISPAVVGWVIGKKGTHLKEMSKKSDTEICVHQESMGAKENRVMYITGNQDCVENAIQGVKDTLPKGQKLATGPGVTADTAPSTKSTPKVNHILYIAPAIVGWVIGKNGTRLGKAIRKSGAEIWIDQESMSIMENRIVHISGTQEAVNIAIDMVKELLPDGFDFEPGPGITSSSASVTSDSLNASVTSPSRTPLLRAPSPDPILEQQLPNLISPPQPIRRPRVVQVGYISSGTSATSEMSAVVSNISYGRQPVTPTAELSTLTTPKSADTILAFLKEQAACLKGSPEAFYLWLSTEDITTLGDLAEAVVDDDYLRNVLQQGDGIVGVKGFRRNAFKKAVFDAKKARDIKP